MSQMDPDITHKTPISQEDNEINHHASKGKEEESNVGSATSEMKQPSTRHYDQCDMMFRIRAEPHPKRKSAPQRRLDAAENLQSV